MLFYFHFGEFQANLICPIFREGHAEFLYDSDACMRGYNFFDYTAQAIVKVSGRMVARYLRAAVHDMFPNNRKAILCPCQRCKEGVWLDPFTGGHLKAHLLMHGFMDDYTRWISEDDD